jgi:hypothetical protein
MSSHLTIKHAPISVLMLVLVDPPARSLLLPALAGFQGPAITVKLTGVSLTPAELSTLLSAAAPFKLRRRAVRFGNGLVSCAHLADVLMATSAGRTWHIIYVSVLCFESNDQNP